MSGAVRIVARDRSDLLGEGPVWSARESALLMIGWVIERTAAPGFIAGFASGFAELTLEPLRIEPIVDPGRRSVGRALRRQLRQPFPRGRTPRSQHRAACLADHELCFRLIGFAG
jgi:hypothetical protein